ncbi:MAG TPA: carboxypeptidase regulatory-like domain-containing protein [Burkholderiales bacterium]|nr:carboxypeptidase regulatory-like domain-containing protein [Burkholderiales bacterium]HYA47879.1 carboxypeptidase regulatory-like domain-containing protein [Burkholderiales bacterium]
MKSTSRLSAGAILLGLALPAWASTAMGYALPQTKTENGVTYMSGGVGKPEAKAMEEEARHYPLSMVFSAAKDHEFLAAVQVTIKNRAGKEVLSTVSDGPILLVKLPAGKYTIAAEAHGKTLHRTVQVPATGERQVSFHWAQA